METFITCKEGCETVLAKEAASYQGRLLAKGRGWVLVKWNGLPPVELCFACHILENPLKVYGSSVNALTEKLLELFTAHFKDIRLEKSWPLLFTSSGEEPLIQRAKTVQKNWLVKLKKKMARVAKLSTENFPRDEKRAEGFFVFFISLTEARVSFRAEGARQQRMQMDPQAPSRSYLKMEEAFSVLGCSPGGKDTVVDLGASPGGWSYSALKRGASVIAVDNGPLKEPVQSHPNITHLKVDAFKYNYPHAKPADWLFCDILEKPGIVLECINTWLSRKWCRRFIVNLKIGRNDPVTLLNQIRDPQKGIASYCTRLHVKQLYHDREEITLVGETR